MKLTVTKTEWPLYNNYCEYCCHKEKILAEMALQPLSILKMNKGYSNRKYNKIKFITNTKCNDKLKCLDSLKKYQVRTKISNFLW